MNALKKDLEQYVATIARSAGWSAYDAARYKRKGGCFQAWSSQDHHHAKELRRLLSFFPGDKAAILESAREGARSARKTEAQVAAIMAQREKLAA